MRLNVLVFVISVCCLTQLQSAETPASEAAVAGFLEQVKDHFADWDKDKSGGLSVAELDQFANNSKTVGNEAAAIAALKRSQNNKKVPAPVLTQETIVALAKVPPPALEGPNFPKMYSEGLSKIKKARRDLFVSELPHMSSLYQGRLGDCFCLAPLGAMLHRNPKQVMEMFKLQPDGSCDVVLGNKTVHVATPTDTELAMSASARQDGIWVNVYEKAMGMLRNEAKPESERTGSPLDAVARGGSAGTVLAQITGHEITRFSTKYVKDDKLSDAEKAKKLQALRDMLIAAVKDKRLMTCGTTTPTTPGITPNHAYAVLGYDEKADTIQLWNPHGTTFTPKEPAGLVNGYPRKNGIFALPLGEFVQQFYGVAFEQAPKNAQP
ncbi:MAG: C2 family cysteine protease [Planctomycetota bacterium]